MLTLEQGAELAPLTKDPITKVQLVKYAGASGDYNLIHTDDETARRAGLDGVIAHGMLSMGFLGDYLARIAGPANIRRLKVRFRQMVRPGDVLTCKGRVKAVYAQDGEPRAVLDLWVENQRGEAVTTGEGEVLLERR